MELLQVSLEQPKLETPVSTSDAPPPAAEAAPAEKPAVTSQEKPPEDVGSRYQKQLDRLMEQARENKRQQDETRTNKEAFDYAQRLANARKAGPEAVAKELGIDLPRYQPQEIDIDKLLGIEKPQSDKTVAELKSKLAEVEQTISELRKHKQEEDRRVEEYQRKQWYEGQLNTIRGHLDKEKEKFQYLDATRKLGSDSDILQFIINMNQRGAQADHGQASEALEAYYDDMLDLLSSTPKFKAKYQAVKPSSESEPKTLTNALSAESATVAPDDDSVEASLRAAQAAKELIRKQLEAVNKK